MSTFKTKRMSGNHLSKFILDMLDIGMSFDGLGFFTSDECKYHSSFCITHIRISCKDYIIVTDMSDLSEEVQPHIFKVDKNFEDNFVKFINEVFCGGVEVHIFK